LTEQNNLPRNKSIRGFGIFQVLDLVIVLPDGSIVPNESSWLNGDDTVDVNWTFLDAIDGTVELVLTCNFQWCLNNFCLAVGDRGVERILSDLLLGLIESFKSQCNSICLPIDLTVWNIIF
jgi:hypothetical protein